MSDHVDVLIIGAGAAGGVAARRLVRAGLSVVCLEQGDWTDPADYPGDKPEWELLASRIWSSSPSVRAAPADYPIDRSNSDMGQLNFNGVGGGTILYNAQWPRMRPDDFRVRSVDGVADDWPVTWEELLPHYERTDEEFGVSGFGGNPAHPPCADPPLPAMPIGEAGLRVARAHAELGWHWWPATNAIASIDVGDRHACVQRGPCGQGCNEGAKGSTDRTHWPDAIDAGARLVTGARVRRIVLDSSGLALGAEWTDRDGYEHLQTAEVVLCAANAIGTARLLLTSAEERHPDGLANGSGLVGRRLMLHPLATVAGVFDHDLRGWRAHNGALIQSLEFSASDPARGFIRGSTWGLGSAGGPMRALLTPDPNGVWGRDHHHHVRSRLGHIAQWAILCEDLPEEHNRVVLDDTHRGSDGVPGVRIEYSLSDNSHSMMHWMIERAGESLRRAGAVSIEATPNLANGHFMGTARMGEDPATSVVDRWCMSHEIPNLGIIDGSVFVTAGSANPTSTIAALASRAADRLIETRTSHSSRATNSTLSKPTATPLRRLDTAVRLESRSSTTFTTEERDRFGAIADVLIPSDGTMPCPSSIDIARHLATVIAARSDLGEDLRTTLAMDETPETVLTSLAADDTLALRALRYCVAGAYYLSPVVRDALGYHPESARPADVSAYPEWLEEGLLDHLFDPRD
jgi:choline dehydrogenase-like flavoprotein